MNRGLLIGVLLVAGAAGADADDGLPPRRPTDLELQACTRVVELARAKDFSRAMHLLASCPTDTLRDGNAALAAKLRELRKTVRDSDLAELSIVSDPPGVAFTISVMSDIPLTTPATVFVPAGAHVIEYRRGDQVMRKDAPTIKHSRSAVILDAVEPAPKEPRTGHVSFEEEGEIEQHAGPPPDVKRGSMLDARYLRKPGARGEALDDPLALGAQHGARPWIGVRLGGGLYDDGATTSTWRPTVAATLRVRLTPRVFLAGRIDWSRRGGTASDAIDTAALNAGAGYTLLATRTLQLAALGQLRGELRFADTRDTMDVSRLGAGASLGLELAFPTTPLTAGLRIEQSLTELVPDSRDRALLIELGVDWR